MHAHYRRYLSLFCLLVVSPLLYAQQLLSAVEWNDETLSLQFASSPTTPQIFQINKTAQLIIDLPETDNGATTPNIEGNRWIKQISIAENHSATRIVLQLKKLLPYRLEQQEQRLQLSFHPPNQALIQLTLENEPLTDTLRKIARHAGKNLILNGEITGNTTLQLNQVHWRDAFDLLVTQHQLQLVEERGVLVVGPPDGQAGHTETIEAERKKLLPPPVTEIIPLHYADAVDLKKTLQSSNEKNPLLSEHGVLGIDERSNSLLIQDDPSHLAQIRTLIEQLDIPAKQVLIESRIVIAANDFSHELGARLGLTHLKSAQQQWGFALSGSSDAVNTALSGTTPELSNRLAVNLPATSPAGRFGLTFGKLSTSSLIDLELSAAQVEGKTEIIANPRIITSNGYEAKIQQGVQIPYRSDTLSGGTDISFKDAVMELKVTPQITPDHQIILTLQVKKDAVGAILCNNCEPSVDTREVKTRVMIGDGETLVIGGIYEERKTDSENRVPLLADLPLIGALFKNRRETDGRGELLIFITPSILDQT